MTRRLAGLKVLIVEDNYLVVTVIEDVLTSAGCVVSGPIPRLAEACDAVSREAFDAAVLDINLNGESAYPLADLLSRRNVPYLFVTGYDRNTMPSEYAARPQISKPFIPKALLSALSSLIKPDAAHPLATF